MKLKVKIMSKKQSDGGRTKNDNIEKKRLEKLKNARDCASKSRVEALSHEKMKKLVESMMKRDPSFVLEVVEEINKEKGPPKKNEEKLAWSKCGNCREMPTPIERVCCQGNPETCTSLLSELVLRLANNYRNVCVVN